MKCVLVPVVVILLLSVSVAQQRHCNCRCKNGGGKCTALLPDLNCSVCSNCGPNNLIPELPKPGPCPFVCQQGNFETLVAHAKYSIGHQGAGVWEGPSNSTLTSADRLRLSLANVQTKDQEQGRCELLHASAENITEAVRVALQQCTAEFPPPLLQPHVKWVCADKQKGREIHGNAGQKNFDNVRRLFSNIEADQATFRNALYCYSGEQIAASILPLCPDVSPSVNERPSHPPPGVHPDK